MRDLKLCTRHMKFLMWQRKYWMGRKLGSYGVNSLLEKRKEKR
jgi:hypothetical protein